MILHYIKNKLVCISDENLFSVNNPKYIEFQSIKIDGWKWVDNHILLTNYGSDRFDFTHTKVDNYYNTEETSNNYQLLMLFLSNKQHRSKNITKSFQ